MAKATIEINDNFNFRFSKKTVGSSDSIRQIPLFVKQYFEENISKRFQLKNDLFYDKYKASWTPRYGYEKYIPNPEIDPLFLIEIELNYSGAKLGGILYRPDFTKDSKIDIRLLDIMVSDDQYWYFNFQIDGLLFWDYKLSHLKHHKEHVERHGTPWDEVSKSVRLNFRDNYEVTNSFKYDNKGELPNQPVKIINQKKQGFPEEKTNLGFILDILPNVFSVIENDELKNGIKKIHMKCKYLNF
jgi:hypothetical protein